MPNLVINDTFNSVDLPLNNVRVFGIEIVNNSLQHVKWDSLYIDKLLIFSLVWHLYQDCLHIFSP